MLEQILAFEQPEFYSIAEVADLLSRQLGQRVRPGTIRYLIQSGKIPDVPRAGGKRVFSEQDVDTIREVIEQRAEGRRHGG
ncbi:helix-turn-helix domain-containing protein [Planctomycetota bacterium]